METVLTLLAILAATLALGLLVRRWERKHQEKLNQTQINNINDMVKRMKNQGKGFDAD